MNSIFTKKTKNENDTIDKKYVYISEACKEGYLTQEQVNSYTKRLSVRKKK